MHPDTSHWRSKEKYDYIDSLPPEGLAWEFLRRNENYQREFNSHKQRRKVDADKKWGLRFFSDPSHSAVDQPIYWSPSADPAVLVMTATPDEFDPKESMDIPISAARKSARTLQVVSVVGDLTFNVIYASGSKPGDPCAALIPIDRQCLSRIETLIRLWRALQGRSVPPDTRMTLQQRRRIKLIIQAIDGHADNATYRQIAEVIYGASRVASDAWKTSSLRDSTIALVRDGKVMVASEYRQLLRHRRRS